MEGGLLLAAGESVVRVKALGGETTCTIHWPDRSGPANWRVTLTNVIAPERAVVKADGEEVAAVTGPGPSISATLVSKPGGDTVVSLETPAPEFPWSFAVIGDTQGRNESLAQAADLMASEEVEFIVHLGDMTTAGEREQYDAFLQAIERAGLAYLTVIGNHDIRGEGADFYRRTLAPLEYETEYGGWRLAFLDTSLEEISAEALTALDENLGRRPNQPTLVFTHVPPFDPLALPGEDPHALMSGADGLLDVLRRHSQVKGVFCGHIHIFHHQVGEAGEPQVVISGGGGARLYAGADQGGFHHYTLITVEADRFSVEPMPFKTKCPVDGIVVRGPDGTVDLELDQLEAMASIEGMSSFQNQYGNVRGEGLYRGVTVASLLELVGGIKEGEHLLVHSSDGYRQTYEYVNVYPPAEGPCARQGPMILAYGFAPAGESLATVPDWPDGPRIAFLPEDGLYSNEDCQASSPPGAGWYEYQSAGARWSRNVVLLEVSRE